MAKLYYYPAQGRAQQIRYTLAASGITWEDCVSGPTPKWQEIGGNLTTNVPMLEMDGKVYTQSSAVLRAVARRGGLYPTEEHAAYLVDNLIAAADDLRTASYKQIFNGTPETNADYAAKTLPKHLDNFARLLGESEFFVGGACTVADLTAYDVFVNFGFNLVPGLDAKYPTLAAFVERVGALEKIAAYRTSDSFKALAAFPALKTK
eukprot:CAMPEP_0119096664 /NCGR_PEP_ID=MMETSP1178-20130426/173514_1 /TAXON_ID=33656 /ORGANISM="unid sp, Strain CCMP2000" /LENGTH=205 /DNA_ID=CAMNT_0007080559 /DNA_START=35 /DNA_END=652 /DNA_ORIENTATION=+